MKFLETTFNEYVTTSEKENLHPTYNKIFSELPKDISNLQNIIFYGPPGVGKYSQVLKCINKYSSSYMKYEKKLICNFNKVNYFFKISDVHFEVDMALLGCNAKLLWNDLFVNIVDVLSSRVNKNGIILCKNFHKIHSELLDCFYSYIQKNFTNINIIFFILTESVTFIPDNIINTCHIIPFSRPSKNLYSKIINKKISPRLNIKDITNIKSLHSNEIIINNNIYNYIDKLYNIICNNNILKYTSFRDEIYDIFIYDIDIGYVLWNILNKLFSENKIKQDKHSYIIIETYSFLQFFNNNYRPIYHLENYLYKIINLINEF
uniref:ATPase AAA-type core domain-containing protein n=1 Tax=viral metagenome TaxID=1070528 RepID=A0A6C0CIH7_9ZZZZ